MKLIKFIAITSFCIARSLLSMDAPKDYNLALLKACENGSLEDVIAAISMGADVNAKDKRFDITPLHFAAKHGHTEIVNILLAFNADIHSNDYGQNTALHYAASNAQLVNILLAAGADIDAQNINKFTALHNAVFDGHTDVVKYLLAAKANKEAKGHNQCTALHCAAGKGYIEIVKLLLAEGADKDAKNKYQQAPLNCAAANAEDIFNVDPNRIAALLLTGDEDKIQTSLNPQYSSIIKLLLQKGANVNNQDIDGNTPLMSACNNIDYRSVKILIKAFDVDVNLINKNGNYALSLVNYKPKIRKVLEIRAKAEKSKSELFNAIKLKNLEQVKQYIKDIKGITFYVYDETGDNPLHMAVKENEPKMVGLILSFVPSLLYMPNKAGVTPVDLAVPKSNLMRMLIGLQPLAQEKADVKSSELAK